jgi:hypothetical protein
MIRLYTRTQLAKSRKEFSGQVSNFLDTGPAPCYRL